MVPSLQSYGVARRIDTLLPEHDCIVVHRTRRRAVSRNGGGGYTIRDTRRRGDDIKRHLPIGVHHRRCIGGDIRPYRCVHRGHMHELVAPIQQARERVGRGGEISAHEGEFFSFESPPLPSLDT